MANYIDLNSAATFEAALEESRTSRIAIFKHSTSCPISSLAKGRIDRALGGDELNMSVYYLDLLRYRAVSDQVAIDLRVQHESPQLIVVEQGKAVYVSTHLRIDPAAIPVASAEA